MSVGLERDRSEEVCKKDHRTEDVGGDGAQQQWPSTGGGAGEVGTRGVEVGADLQEEVSSAEPPYFPQSNIFP